MMMLVVNANSRHIPQYLADPLYRRRRLTFQDHLPALPHKFRKAQFEVLAGGEAVPFLRRVAD